MLLENGPAGPTRAPPLPRRATSARVPPVDSRTLSRTRLLPHARLAAYARRPRAPAGVCFATGLAHARTHARESPAPRPVGAALERRESAHEINLGARVGESDERARACARAAPRCSTSSSRGRLRTPIFAVHEGRVVTPPLPSSSRGLLLATFAQFERRLIPRRTKEPLAVKKASGVRLGRPPTLPQAVVRRIQRQRARGHSLRKIAEDLNQAGVPTAQGGAMVHGDCSARAASNVVAMLGRRRLSVVDPTLPLGAAMSVGACSRQHPLDTLRRLGASYRAARSAWL